MLPQLPTLEKEDEADVDPLATALPLREGVRDFRPRSGWRTQR
jgi:hypothetical protein